ncbi:autotransporter domain-containing protein [Legionella lytica]|uniref:Autotransporter domain-containing protein n=1 Tax=Legionella lytica TaxID=96232 RepID=A0ABW8D5G5_9GAMM
MESLLNSPFGKLSVVAALAYGIIAEVNAAVCPPLVANGVVATINGCEITTTAGLGYGVYARNGGTANVNNSTITTSGTNAYGAYALNAGSKLVLSNTIINTTNSAAYGAYAQGVGAFASLDGVIITTAAINAVGVNITGGASGEIYNSMIETRGNNGHGISTSVLGTGSVASNVVVGGTKVVVYGINSYGISASDGNTMSFSNRGSVETKQNYEHAAYSARNSALTIDDSTLLTTALGAYGAYARTGAIINLQNNSTVSTLGNTAYGLISQAASTINATNTTVETFGSQSIGAYTFGGSRIDLINSEITTHGTGAYALYANAGAGVINTLNATNTQLVSDNAASIVANGGITNIFLSHVTNTSGTNEFLLVNTAATVEGPFELNGLSLPDGIGPNGVSESNALPTANPSQLLLIADNSTLTGDVRVAAESSADLFLQNNTILSGAIDPANLTIDATSLWNLTGDSVLNNLILSGVVSFQANGNNFKTLTVENDLIGNNGFISLNTFLGSDGSPSDLVIINGGTASGITGLIINNTTGLGALTTGNGIQVIDAINEGTTTGTAFQLVSPAIAGPFEYRLYRSGLDGTNENSWYLRSLCPPENPHCSVEPDPPVPPGPGPRPEYRQEIGLYPVLPAMTLLYGQALIDTLHQRVGQRKWVTDPITVDNSSKRIWGRVIGMRGDRDRITSRKYFRSSSYDYNFAAMQIGGDLYEHTTAQGTRNHVGVYGAFGRVQGDVKRPHRYLGSNEFVAYTIGGYWTLYSPTEAYIDTVLQGTSYTNARSNSSRIPALETGGWGFAASVEGGYPFAFQQQWLVEPQGQLVYQSIDLDNTRDIAALIRFRNNESLAGRLGIRLANKHEFGHTEGLKKLTTWFRPNYWYQFKGNPQAQFSSAAGYLPFQSQLEGSTLELNLGTTLDLPNHLALYANGSYGVGLNLHANTYNGQIGFKVALA